MNPPLRLSTSRRLVVKIGTSLLFANDQIQYDWISHLADDIAVCCRQGQKLVIVSSGAVAIGRHSLGLTGLRFLKLEEKQAAASVGQMLLANAYQHVLTPYHLKVAQILVTLEDTEVRRRHLNVRDTINTLLKFDIVPVINENDTITTEGIRVGDNDRLAARVAQMISADTLLLLSDIDGFYTANPKSDPNAVRIPVIRRITPEIEAAAQNAPPGYSIGGMKTKITAASIAMTAGCRTVITNGKRPHPLLSIEEDTPCTWFIPSTTPRKARKLWIAGHLQVSGVLTIDEGATSALLRGSSLLPVGVTKVQGQFERGDLVAIHTQQGIEIGSGLCAYNADEARRVQGKKSIDFVKILGYHSRDEMIHRDNLVFFNEKIPALDPEYSKQTR